LLQDASVWSVQTVTFPAGPATAITPRLLLELYLEHIRRFTLGLVRPSMEEGGVHFSLPGGKIRLISFTPPETENDSLTLRICGGLLVQRDNCTRGELIFSVTPEADGGATASLCLADYCPLILGDSQPSALRKWLYRFTQAAIHKLVTIRFLARVYRRYCGSGSCIRVVQVPSDQGENI
jgi:hypothetical protein